MNSFYEEMTGREFVYAMTALYGFPLRAKSAAAPSRRWKRSACPTWLDGGWPAAATACGSGSSWPRPWSTIRPSCCWTSRCSASIPADAARSTTCWSNWPARGKTILVSSHILVEIEHLADTILMIARGRLIASGTLDEVRSQLEDRPLVVEIVSSEARRLAACWSGLPKCRASNWRDDQLLVRTSHPARFFASLNELVLHEELEIQRLQTLDAGADAIFGYLEQGSA